MTCPSKTDPPLIRGSELRRLKELDQKNKRLKKIIAQQALGINALKELLEKSCKFSGETASGALSGLGKGVLRAPYLPVGGPQPLDVSVRATDGK